MDFIYTHIFPQKNNSIDIGIFKKTKNNKNLLFSSL